MAGTGKGYVGVQRNHPMAQGHMPPQTKPDAQSMEKPEMKPCVEVPNIKNNGQGAAEDEGE